MKKLKVAVLATVVSLYSATVFSAPRRSAPVSPSRARNVDVIETFFIKTGTALLTQLTSTPEGRQFLREIPVSAAALAATLNPVRIAVSEAPVYDVTSDEVDAKVENGVIYLYRTHWLQHMRTNTRIQMLVFHEMLRSAGITEDNYLYSKNLDAFSQQRDPQGSWKLSRYINPGEIQIRVTDASRTSTIAPFVVVNDTEAKIVITGSNVEITPSIRQNQDNIYTLNIPVNSTGETKMIVYRIDYEFSGTLKKNSLLHSKREVRFQSVTKREKTDQYFSPAPGTAAIVTDLVYLESAYKESLQIQVANRIVSQSPDPISDMVLKRVVVYFSVSPLLRLIGWSQVGLML